MKAVTIAIILHVHNSIACLTPSGVKASNVTNHQVLVTVDKSVDQHLATLYPSHVLMSNANPKSNQNNPNTTWLHFS